VYGKYLLLAEQDGASVNISGLFRSIASVVGSVFGGSEGKERDTLENGEGCRGLADLKVEDGM